MPRTSQTFARESMNPKPDEELFREIMNALPGIAWCAEPDGSVHFTNKGWGAYTGLSEVQGYGDGWRKAIHANDLPALLSRWKKAMQYGDYSECQARLRRFDGEYRWFLFRIEPLVDRFGQVQGWYGINTDIDDLKRIEEKLIVEQRELLRIPDAIPQTIIVQDSEGRPIYANQAVLDYTGLAIHDVTAPGFRERIFHPEDFAQVREQRVQSLKAAAPFEIEQRARRHDGEYRWFRIKYRPFRDEHGRLVRWYATGTDIENDKKAAERAEGETLTLREDLIQVSMFEEIIGSSEKIRQVLAQLSKIAPTNATVLILGETGTGKELIARAIHERSGRSSNAFIRVNCAAIPQALIASELFGHEKGAFTGALQRRLGRFESAHGGTIFLDEVGELPTETQIALLRILQEREFERVGGTQTIAVDVRIIAATNRDLQAAVAAGSFREDLFYRLNVIPVRVPPLRERKGDLRLLTEYFVSRFSSKIGKRIRSIRKQTIELFESYSWPGNIRELQNVIERAVILCEGENLFVDEAWLTPHPEKSVAPHPSAGSETLTERQRIEAVLRETYGRISGPSGAAIKLGMPRQTLESKIRRFGINWHNFKKIG